MFLFFQYFYGILQSFVDVEPPVYVMCMMKYDIENVKYVIHTLCKHPGCVVHIYSAPSAYIVGYMTYIYLQYIQTHYCEDALGALSCKS